MEAFQHHPAIAAIVIGVSAGGLPALTYLLQTLPAGYPLPLLIVQHRMKDENSLLEHLLQTRAQVRVRQAEEKEKVSGGTAYLAPADYHLLVERDETLSLSCDAPVNFSRPAIDVLFETAAEVYGERLMGLLLTGASKDGARGMVAIRQAGGVTVAQDPATAQFPLMPQSAIDTGQVQYVLPLEQIRALLLQLGQKAEGGYA